MVSRVTTRVVLCVLWLAAVSAGLAVIWSYQNTSGETGACPSSWPDSTKLAVDRNAATLLMFVHPHCPCSRASMGELNRLLALSKERIAAHVLFLHPEGHSLDWVRSDLWRTAAAIPGVTVHSDTRGAEAQRFGAETSGFVVLYGKGGQRLFSGGITAARGHAGDNAGVDAIVSLLDDPIVATKQTPVFGCSLVTHCPTSDDKINLCAQ